jgi:O-antigen ligase
VISGIHNRVWIALIGLYLLLLVIVGVLLDVEPYELVLLPVIVLGGAILLFRYPAVMFAVVLFVGSFKTKAVTEFSLKDPSILCLGLAALAVLFAIPVWRLRSLGELFSGQGNAIIAFLVFLLVVVMSYTYTVAPNMGAHKLLKFGAIDSLLFFAPMMVFKREEHIRQFVWAVVVLSIALTVRVLLGLFDPTVLPLVPARPGEFATQLGAGQLLGITVLLIFFSKQLTRWPKSLAAVTAIVVGTGLIASAARGPLVSVFVALLAGAFMMRPVLGSKKLLVATAVLVVCAFASMAVFVEQLPSARDTFARKQSELMLLFSGASPGGTAEQRVEMFNAATDAFLERPILGWGVGGWGVYYRGTETPPDWPHNIFLDVLVDEGLVGMFAFLVLLALIIGKLKYLVQSGSRFDFLAPVCLYCLLISMPSNDIDSRVLWFWTGTVLAASRLARSEPERIGYVLSWPTRRAHAPHDAGSLLKQSHR